MVQPRCREHRAAELVLPPRTPSTRDRRPPHHLRLDGADNVTRTQTAQLRYNAANQLTA
jgi:hypothetical protein